MLVFLSLASQRKSSISVHVLGADYTELGFASCCSLFQTNSLATSFAMSRLVFCFSCQKALTTSRKISFFFFFFFVLKSEIPIERETKCLSRCTEWLHSAERQLLQPWQKAVGRFLAHPQKGRSQKKRKKKSSEKFDVAKCYRDKIFILFFYCYTGKNYAAFFFFPTGEKKKRKSQCL